MSTKAWRVSAWCVAGLLAPPVMAAARGFELADAVKKHDEAAIRALLEQKADVNGRQPDGATALHWAAHWDDHGLAAMLIAAGADAKAVNDYGVSPLALASTNGSLAMVGRLLDAGADPNAARTTGETPLMTATRTGNVAVVKALLARGADVNASGGGREQTALMWAAASGRADVARVLIESGADVHARSQIRPEYVSFGRGDPQGGRLRGRADGTMESDGTRPGIGWLRKGGFTALSFAVQQGDFEMTRLLLDAGASANETAASDISVLVLAALNERSRIAQFLLARGADPNVTTTGYSALHLAVAARDDDLVQALLARGAKPNVQIVKGTPRTDDAGGRVIPLPEYLVGATPFLLASALNELDIMQLLITAGADPKLAMQDGTTALSAAMGINPGILGYRPFGSVAVADLNEYLILETVKMVVDLGVDINAARTGGVIYHGANPRTTIGRDDGDTALHTATADKRYDVVEFLISRGARTDLRDKRGLTPLAMALSTGGVIASGAEGGGARLGDARMAATLQRLGASE